jgi:phage tail sheath protein FI
MPVTPTYPGIYIEELRSLTHSITAAPTSVTVFIGYTHPFKTKPEHFGKAVEVFSFTDYEREFGGLYTSGVIESHVAYAVQQFFLNGGSDAYIVGLQPNYYDVTGAAKGVVTPATLHVGNVLFTALEPVDAVPMTVSISNSAMGPWDLTISYGSRSETFRKVNLKPTDANFLETRINNGSQLVGVSAVYDTPFVAGTVTLGSLGTTANFGNVAFTAISTNNPDYPITVKVTPDSGKLTAKIEIDSGGTVVTLTGVSMNPSDPNFIGTQISNDVSAHSWLVGFPVLLGVNQAALAPSSPVDPFWTTFNELDFTGVFAQDGSLDKVSIFNLLLIPGVADNGIWSEALAFCERKQAFVILDPPAQDSADGEDGLPLIGDDIEGATIPKSSNGALYFPYLRSNDPLTGTPIELPPSGFVAGIYARTDVNRGVWKAPAGLETTVSNTTGVVSRGRMTDMRHGTLNPKGVNCLRDFPGIGTVVFGARTLVTENPSFEQWRYVPVRRMALFLEQTLYRSLGWVVFEPNDTPLWVAIRTSIEAFMLSLFHQGAFQGNTPSQAFQVKCDSSTTTQQDIDNGIVNIIVAFAPLKPAEFVIIKIAQLAGQTQ